MSHTPSDRASVTLSPALRPSRETLGGRGQALELTASKSLSAKADALIGGFTQSMMKKPQQFAPGKFPVYLKGGQGALVEDVDGQIYIDYICGLAANTLGHNHPAVVGAVTRQLMNGVLHSLPAPLELAAAAKITEVVPGSEMVRFFKTGADATSAAVRLARAITGKEQIVITGYHGWHDHFMFDTPGVPKAFAAHTHRLPLFTPADEPKLMNALTEHGDSLACVLLAVPYNRVLDRAFLVELRERCAKHDVLFVIDEVMTGFRLALGGAQQFYDLDADFVCLSKGIAAGFPLSAVAGKKRHLARYDELQVSTTFGGELLSLAVCEAVLSEYQVSGFNDAITALGQRLKEGLNPLAKKLEVDFAIVGYDAIPLFKFSADMASQQKIAMEFVGEMAERGVLLRRDVNFICGVHTTEQIDYTVKMAAEVLALMKERGTVPRL